MRFILSLSILVVGISANAKSVLMIGDSLSCLESAFGPSVVEIFKSKGFTIDLYCAIQSAPQHWLEGKAPAYQRCRHITSSTMKFEFCSEEGGVMPSFKDLLAKHKNSDVVIALGTNSLSKDQVGDEYEKMLIDIQKAKRKCLWIGPPHINPAQYAMKIAPREALVTMEK